MRGKGMWIWQVEKCEGGKAAGIVTRAQKAGLGHVLLKIADGVRPYNVGRISDLVTRLRAAGIEPWAWAYTYGSDAAAEARAAAEIYARYPFAGFVVNAETEYKGYGARATAYMRALRAALPPGTVVGLSSFWSPDYHPTFPWREFLGASDLGLPQVYWHGRDPAATLAAACAQWGRYVGALVPTGAAYTQAAPGDSIEQFAAAAATWPAVNYWSWQHATPAMWQVIARATTGGESMATTRDVERIARDICGLFAAGRRGNYYVGKIKFELTDIARCSEFVREVCEAAAKTADHGPLSARYFGGSARETEAKLRARGTRIVEQVAVPGDIVCFNAGAAGPDGHIGIHLGNGDFAENTSSAGRGPGFVISRYTQIGRDRISGFYHLPEFDRAQAAAPPKVILGRLSVPNLIECNARLEDGKTRVDLRGVVEGMGMTLMWDPATNKSYIDVTAAGMLSLIEWMRDEELGKLQDELHGGEVKTP